MTLCKKNRRFNLGQNTFLYLVENARWLSVDVNTLRQGIKENWMSIWLPKAILTPILLLRYRAVIKRRGPGISPGYYSVWTVSQATFIGKYKKQH